MIEKEFLEKLGIRVITFGCAQPEKKNKPQENDMIKENLELKKDLEYAINRINVLVEMYRTLVCKHELLKHELLELKIKDVFLSANLIKEDE